MLPQSPHGAQHGATLVTPVVSPPRPGLGADVRVQGVEAGEGEAAMVAAQRELLEEAGVTLKSVVISFTVAVGVDCSVFWMGRLTSPPSP